MDRGGDSYLHDRNRVIQGNTPPRVNGTEKREIARENVSYPSAYYSPNTVKILGRIK